MEQYENMTIEEIQKSVWATLDRIGERLDRASVEAEERQAKWDAERKVRQAEAEERQAKWDAERKVRQAEADKRLAEAEKRQAEFERDLKNFKDKSGVYSQSVGSFAEEYFFNSFNAGKTNFFGEKFDIIEKHVKGISIENRDEYDILLTNKVVVCIVEVKFKAHENDIPKVLKKAETFRLNFPEYKNHKAYLSLASISFYNELEQLCKGNGIAIIKQVGDTVVIYDEHLKVY